MRTSVTRTVAGKVVVVGVLVLAACLFSLAARRLLETGWSSVVDYRSPYVYELAPGSADSPTSPVAESVVLVVVDGLRADVALTREHIMEVAARGASRSLVTGQPSLSLPTWTTIAAGAFQEVSGVTTNWWKPGGGLPDTVFAAARRAGRKVVVVGDVGWRQLFGQDITEGYYEKAGEGETPAQVDARVFERARLVLAQAAHRPDGIVVVHFSSVDAAGEDHGAASVEYTAAVNAVDGWIGRLASLVDPLRSVLMVTSDHGQVRRGGHGGWEPDVVTVPLAACGKGIVPGKYAAAKQADLGPTICAVLGCGYPRHVEGNVMWDMLALPPFQKSEKTIRLAETKSRYAQAYAGAGRAAGTAPGAGLIRQAYLTHNDKSYEIAARFASMAVAEAEAAIARARAARLARARLLRVMPILVAGLAGLLPLAVLVVRRPGWRYAAVVGGVCYFVVYYGLWLGRGFTFSLSVFRKESMMMPFFNGRMIDAVISGAVACAVAGVTCNLLGSRRSWNAVACSVAVVYLVLAGLVLQALPFVAGYGLRFSAFLPDFRQAFKYYVDLLQAVAVGLAAAVLVGVGWLAAAGAEQVRRWLGRRRRGRLDRLDRPGRPEGLERPGSTPTAPVSGGLLRALLVLAVAGACASVLCSGCGPGDGTRARARAGREGESGGAGQAEFFGLALYPGARLQGDGAPPAGGFGQVEARSRDEMAAVERFYTERVKGENVQQFDFTDDEGYRTVVLIEKSSTRLRSVTISGKAGAGTTIQLKSVERK